MYNIFNTFKRKAKKTGISYNTVQRDIKSKQKKVTDRQEKKHLLTIAKGQLSTSQMVDDIILPSKGKTTRKDQRKYKESIDYIHTLLKKSQFVDNIKADTLRKLIFMLEEDNNFQRRESAFIKWLSEPDKIKVVKKINVLISKD